MLDRLAELQKKWIAEGLEPLSFGVGINTGEVIVGNIGAEGLKMEYTVIGDNVNLTYRIQNESRVYDCPVMTESTWQLVQDVVEAEPLGPIMVKGKQKPVVIYALRGLKAGSRTPGAKP
jgi:adenylate cyclase